MIDAILYIVLFFSLFAAGYFGLGKHRLSQDLAFIKAKLESEQTTLKTFFKTLPDLVWIKDIEGKYLACNHVFERFFGAPEAEIIGKTDADFVNTELAAFFVQKDKEAIAAGCAKVNEEWITFANDGRRALLKTTKSPLINKDSMITGVMGIGHDVTAIKEAENHLRTMLDNLPDVIVRYDRYCRRIYVNPQYEKVNELNAMDVLGKTPEERSGKIAPIAADFQSKIKAVFDHGEQTQVEFDWINADGSKTIYDLRAIPEYDEDGKVISVLTIARDISDIKRAEYLLKEKEREFRTLVENSPDIIVRYDRDCRRIFVNPAYLRETGISIEKALNNSIDDASIWRPTMSREEYRQRLQQVMDTEIPDKILLEWNRYDGQHVSHEIYVVAEYNVEGEVVGALAIGRDVTHSKQIEQQLVHQASYDLLTGLPNRRLFGERLHHALAQAKREKKSLGLLFIDLDRFKFINDTMGHEIGDQLLIGVAQRIRQCVRESDTVARLAGDEFVTILPNSSDAHFLTRVVRSISAAIAQPFHFGEQHTHTSACIGVAIYPQDAKTAEALISCADQAMYAAKNVGQNNFSFFNEDMLAKAKQRIYLANELHNALDNGELEVYYQPIIDVASGRTIKAEALLHWHHPQLGMVPPDQFIPLAEETDLILTIGHWVFCKVVEAAYQWNHSINDNQLRQISVNMSPKQFTKDDIEHQFIHYLKTHKHDPAHIAIEITEGLLLDDSIDTTNKLDSLRAAGFEISLDDFGTGYATMAYLKKINIDYLKIDRSFVKDLETDPAAQAIAEAIIVMAHRLDLKVIAEGVETKGQYDLLAAMNCEYMQGYLFAKPMPLEQLITFVGDDTHRSIQTQPDKHL